MKLHIYPLTADEPLIRPATAEREWMDETPERFAYRCLPLNMANQHGWELLCGADIAATWDGGGDLASIRIEGTGPERFWPMSHFGNGVLTFAVPALLRTEPGYNLWVSGPINAAKDGIAPLSALIETDWSPFSFTMNWRFTRPHETVMFSLGEPFCHFFALPRALAEETELVSASLDDAPELAAHYAAWSAARTSFNADLLEEGSEARRQRWQRAYFQGRNPDGSPGSPAHQTKLDLCPYRP
jgi:hypothetical protein